VVWDFLSAPYLDRQFSYTLPELRRAAAILALIFIGV
jgi:hypothetical protein